MDWDALRLNGRPLANARPRAPKELERASEWLDILRKELDRPFSSFLGPCTMQVVERRNGLFVGFKDVPGPSPRERAQAHASRLSEYLIEAAGHLRSAQFCARFGLCDCEPTWGEHPPDLIIGTRKLAPTFPSDWSNVHLQWKRLRVAVRRKQQRLRRILETIVEPHALGTVCRVDPSDARVLAHEPDPLIVKVKRIAEGMLYERA